MLACMKTRNVRVSAVLAAPAAAWLLVACGSPATDTEHNQASTTPSFTNEVPVIEGRLRVSTPTTSVSSPT